MQTPRIECAFETPRLRVALWRTDEATVDLPAVVMDLLTPAVTASLPEAWQGPYTWERATAWIHEQDAEATVLLVTQRDEQQPIGLMLLYDSSPADAPNSEMRIGYLLSEGSWGRGYASELLSGFTTWVGESSYREVLAGVARGNAPSGRVLEKSGFTRVETGDGEEEFFVFRN